MVPFASSFLERCVRITEEDAEEKLTGIRIGFNQRKQLELKAIVRENTIKEEGMRCSQLPGQLQNLPVHGFGALGQDITPLEP